MYSIEVDFDLKYERNIMKDKSLNVPATLDIMPQENHKTQISSSIVCFLLESNKNYIFHWK